MILAFVWLLITCLSFFSRLFSFSLFYELVTYVCCQRTHQGRDWGPERPRTDGWSPWLWWVFDNVVWTDFLKSIAGASCGLICVGAGEERARKVYALWGLRRVERQVGLTRGTRWPAGSSAGRMVPRKARRSRRSEPVQVAAHNRSLHMGFAVVHHKTGQVIWLNHKTKTGGSAGRDGIRARRKASMSADTWWDRRACVERMRTAEKAWS
jgi:hypothetical protein